MRVGLTGGLGAGKSSVARLLAEFGAVVIDADEIAREVVRAGTPGFAAVVDRFGPGIVAPDGELDRPRLGEIVFADDAARADLNAIVHPLVAERTEALTGSVADGAIVVYDIPLLVENDLAAGFDVVVVVEADVETRLRRLTDRGLPEDQARARMAVQASDAERRAVAGEVLRNDGDLESLAAQVEELWRRLCARESQGP